MGLNPIEVTLKQVFTFIFSNEHGYYRKIY